MRSRRRALDGLEINAELGDLVTQAVELGGAEACGAWTSMASPPFD